MTRFQSQPPWEFLLTASKVSLQSYELSRWSCAANLRKEVATLLDQWMQESTMASLARLLIEGRERAHLEPAGALSGHAERARGGHTASYNIFSDLPLSPPNSEAND